MRKTRHKAGGVVILSADYYTHGISDCRYGMVPIILGERNKPTGRGVYKHAEWKNCRALGAIHTQSSPFWYVDESWIDDFLTAVYNNAKK